MGNQDIILKVENISKQYRLGVISTGTISHDLNRWWHKVRGKEDPFLKIGESNNRATKGESDYVWALKDINFEVKRGEVLGIIGKNGAGKSTLLKILSRVTGPTTGSIKSAGRIASLLEVGTGFHPELTGKENIFLNGAILGMTKSEILSKLDEIVEFSGCERYVDTPVKRYSSGMRVRLAFAVAAFLEPDILVVDEVLAVGDAEFQNKAIGKMKDISSGEGRTVLFVSHNMASVSNLCDRAIILENGKIKKSGATEAIIKIYLNSNFQLKKTKLIDRKDRKGGNLVNFRNIRFLEGHDHLELYTLISGQKIIIEFDVVNESNVSISNVDIAIAFYTKSEEHLFNCSSIALDKFFTLEPGCNKINLLMDRWPTSEGNYSYNIQGKKGNEILDYIQNAGDVFVELGDFYGSGKLPAQGKQGIFVDYKFNVV